jgi:hypothetical protein
VLYAGFLIRTLHQRNRAADHLPEVQKELPVARGASADHILPGGVVKKLLKLILYTLGGLLAFVLLLAGLTQTQFFRDRLRAAALERLDSLLDAQAELGELTGDLINGFTIDYISIKVGETHLIVAERLDIKYDLLEIPGRTISVSKLTLVRPSLTLVRGADGEWNFTRMIRSSPGESSGGGSFNWVLRVKSFEIQEATVAMVDSLALADPDHPDPDSTHVEYHDLKLTQFNFSTSAEISKGRLHANIFALSFHSDVPALTLQKLSGDILVTPDSALVKGLEIRTRSSSIKLDATMRDFDLFGGIDLKNLRQNQIEVSLDAHNIDLNELKSFIPALDFLHGAPSVVLEATGEFGNLYVKKLEVKTGQTELYFAGSVLNLHTPERLFLAIKCTQSRVYEPDALALMPTFHLPDFASLGVATLNLEYEGTPVDFKTKFLLETDAGNVHANVGLKIGGEQTLTYKAELLTMDINLARVFSIESIPSKLTGTVEIAGTGVSMETLNAMFKARFDSSEFKSHPLRNTEIGMTAAGRTLHGTFNTEWRGMSAALSASLDDRGSKPTYTVEGKVKGLNVADIVHDGSYDSDLTMEVNVQGDGLTWDMLNGQFDVALAPSRFGEYKINGSDLRLEIDQRDHASKHLRFESSIADLDLRGAFELDQMGQLIMYEVLSLRSAIAQKFVALDSSLVSESRAAELANRGGTLAQRPIFANAEYTLVLKDLEPVSIVTGNRTFNGTGTLTGSIIGSYDNLKIRGDLELKDFFYGDVESGVLIEDGSARFNIEELRPHHPLASVEADVDIQATQMHINRMQFDSLAIRLSLRNETAHYEARTAFDRNTRLSLAGDASVTQEAVSFVLEELALAYEDYAWKADSNIFVSFNSRGMSIDGFSFRQGVQTVKISGSLHADRSLAVSLVASDLDLRGLKYVMNLDDVEARRPGFEGRLSIVGSAHGTLDDPSYAVSFHADDVFFRTLPFGRVQGELRYANRRLTADVAMEDRRSTGEKPELTVVGYLPVDLSLGSSNDHLTDEPMSLHIRSDGVQMNILDPLLPTFDQLNGVLRCDLTLVGSPQSPQYRGSISIEECSFLFVPNNIMYTFAGSFKPDGERIRVLDAVVRNIAADRRFGREGEVHLSGDFALRSFKPTDFNLTATGQLLVIKESTRLTRLSLYGSLFIEIGNGGLKFTGTLENSSLRGSLIVRNSSLVFPPTETTPQEQSPFSIPIILVDDTAKVPVRSSPVTARYFGVTSDTESRINRYEAENVASRSFLDGVHYNLDVETTGGNTDVRMIFNAATGEELLAYVDGKYLITEDGTRWFGDVTVSRSQYNFYNKHFDADGELRWRGDVLDPELDITAKYEGTRTPPDSAKTERVVVTVKIGGTRLKPKPEISMTIDGVDYYAYEGAKSSDVQSDALTFILSGAFPLNRSERNNVAQNIGSTAGLSLLTGATSLLTSTLSDFLRTKTGFINSVELSYRGEGSLGESADIRVSGVAFSGLWRYGGKILGDPVNNANVSLLYSVGDLFNTASLRNFMVELERRIETTTLNQTVDAKGVNSARLFYRISF